MGLWTDCFCKSRRKKRPKKREQPQQRRNVSDSDSDHYNDGNYYDNQRHITLQRNGRRLKARKKLEEDRRKIQEGLELGSSPSDPFAGLPEVVMLDYLEKYLKNPKDKLNLAEASPSAGKLLEKARVKFLFNEILPIPTFHTLLSKQDLIHLQAVCRDWKNSFDNFWSSINDVAKAPPDYSHYKSILTSPSTLSLARYRSPHLSLLRSFTPNLDATLRNDRYLDMITLPEDADELPFNPFPSRRAAFQSNSPYYNSGSDERYYYCWNKVFTLLDRFGGLLRSARIVCYNDVKEAPQIVKTCLDRTPLLSTLDCDLYKLYGVEVLDRLPSLELPSLPNLRKLMISYGFQPMYVSFTKYFPQLVSLQVQSSPNFMFWFNPSIHLFPKLEHLTITIEDDGHLDKVRMIRAPCLREIDIRSALVNLSPLVYFYHVEHLKGTLASVKVDLDYICNCAEVYRNLYNKVEGMPNSVDLPNLKTLSMNIMECGFGPVDALLGLSHPPEYLELVVVNCPWDGKPPQKPNTKKKKKNKKKLKARGDNWEETLMIHEYRRSMYESNIWRMLPFLKEIHVREAPTTGRAKWVDTFYSREGYEVEQLD